MRCSTISSRSSRTPRRRSSSACRTPAFGLRATRSRAPTSSWARRTCIGLKRELSPARSAPICCSNRASSTSSSDTASAVNTSARRTRPSTSASRPRLQRDSSPSSASARPSRREREARSKKCSSDRPRARSTASTPQTLTTSSSRTSPFGRSAPARPLPHRTRTTRSRSFAALWASSTARRTPRREFASNTAAR